MPTDEPVANPFTPPDANLIASNTGELKLASRGRRLGGAIIDTIILSLLIIPTVLLFFGSWDNYITKAAASEVVMQISVGVLGLLVYLLVNTYWLMKNGQTVGKKLLGTKIVRTDGSRADYQRIILRRYLPMSFAYLIPVVGMGISIINALLIFRQSHQCGHDNLADTVVIDINAS